MADIKPGEIAEILKMELAGLKADSQFEEIGRVLQVGDGIARLYGLTNVRSNELIEFENGIMGIVLNLEEDNIGVVLLGSSEEIKEGFTAKGTGRIASINVGEGMAARMLRILSPATF